MTLAKKNIAICADDYGLSKETSQGILELIDNNRITGTSVMPFADNWASSASDLLDRKRLANIGLHLSLTEHSGLPAISYNYFPFLFSLFKNTIDKSSIQKALFNQFEKFIDDTGMLPNYIDSHHHIHLLPKVRDIFLDVYNHFYPRHDCLVRNTYENVGLVAAILNPKALLINKDGKQLSKELIKRNIPHNHGFRGVYSFSKSVNYSDLFNNFLVNIKNNSIIMCHPASHFTKATTLSTVNLCRTKEYSFLNSNQFLEQLTASNIQLVKPIQLL